MKLRPLFEDIPVELQLTEVEENGQKYLKARGVFHRADEINANKRIYPSKLLERETKKLNERLSDSVFMQADHPTNGQSSVPQTAALLSSISYDPKSKEVIGEAKILDTGVGRDLAAIIRAGGKVGISARGFGTTSQGEYAGQKGSIVDENYQLVTYDFVIGQSTRNAVVSSFSEQATLLAEGEIDMDITTINIDEFKKARPDLFTQVETAAKTEAEKTANEAVETRVKSLVNEETKKIEAKLRDELKAEGKKKQKTEAMSKKDMANMNDPADDPADEGDDVSELMALAKKLGYKVVKEDVTQDNQKVEQEVESIRTKLNEAQQTITVLTGKQSKLEEQARAIEVDKYIMEKTSTEKKFRNSLIERLRKTCASKEEVDAKLPQERTAIERLLAENNVTGKGNPGVGTAHEELGSPADEDATEKKYKTKSGKELTEAQLRQRTLAGIPTELLTE